jgi:hypothetical protein
MTKKRIELQTIEQILDSNGYDPSIIEQFNKPKRKDNSTDNKDSWAKFTYFGREIRAITKLFNDTRVQVSYKVNNTINKHLSRKPHNQKPMLQFQQSGVYSLTCPDCHKKICRADEPSFKKRYSEHFHDYKYNIRKSSFATHLLDNNHSIGSINDIMKILHTTNKGPFMDTVEKYHIYMETQANNQINDKNTVKPNAIFDTINSLELSPPKANPLHSLILVSEAHSHSLPSAQSTLHNKKKNTRKYQEHFSERFSKPTVFQQFN